jgi:hypothetical protein
MDLDQLVPAIVASGVRLSAKLKSPASVSPPCAIPHSALVFIEGDPGRLKGVTVLRSAWELEVDAPLTTPAPILDAIEEYKVFLCSLVRMYKTHSWASCDKCGAGMVIKRGNSPECTVKPGCKGHHRELDLLGQRRKRKAPSKAKA